LSTDLKITGVIPARYGSTRFQGKPLAMIGSRTMIEWTYINASRAGSLDEVIVATDDERIFKTVESFGGRCMMTSAGHPSGTDRIIEVAENLPDTDIIVNIQGDEPGIEPELIDGVAALKIKNRDWDMTTAAVPMTENLNDPNRVKVVFDIHGKALYFSRSLIPSNFKSDEAVFRHLGIYCYEMDFLLNYHFLPASSYEKSESLEQLRAMQAGKSIGVFVADKAALAVDTEEDLQVVIKDFQGRGLI